MPHRGEVNLDITTFYSLLPKLFALAIGQAALGLDDEVEAGRSPLPYPSPVAASHHGQTPAWRL